MRLIYIFSSFFMLMIMPLACGSEMYSLLIDPPGEGRIAFRSTRNETWEIYAINPDSSGLVNMSNHLGRDWDFTWSPDGSRLVFISSRNDRDPEGCNLWCTTEIYTINANGNELTRLTEVSAMNRNPMWSPDGTQLVFASSRDETDPSACPFNCNFEIYIMNVNGSEQTRLTNSPEVDHLPNWSPDGTRIAFTSQRDGNSEIYVMNSDGSGLIRLTDDPGSDFWPVWSPDGTKIAFISNRNYPDSECVFAECQYDIFVMSVAGTQSQTAGENNLIQIHRTNSFFVNFYSVWWSPDGTKLLSHVINDDNYDIFVANIDGSGHVYVTNTPDNELSPVWGPDGNRIAFTSDRDGNPEIYIMDVSGSNLTRLTNDPANGFLPIWSSQ